MKNFTIYYEGCAEYIADSEEEAIAMFENDHFGGYTMDIEDIIEEDEEEEED